MKRLSQTWRQMPKSSEKNPKNVVINNELSSSTFIPRAKGGTPRRSQRLAKGRPENDDDKDASFLDTTKTSNKRTPNNVHKKKVSLVSGQCSQFNSSFGFEFDADALSAVDKIEQDHREARKKPVLVPGVSPIIPLNVPEKCALPLTTSYCKAQDMQSTPKVNSSKKMVGQSNTRDESKQVPLTSNNEMSAVTRTTVCETLQQGMSTDQAAACQTVDLQKSNRESPDMGTSNRQTLNNEALQISTEESSTHNKSRMESSSQGFVSQEQCELTSWGLPDTILEQYKKIGITTMFEWQAQCLRTGNVLNGGNLVYSAPTSAGKTMVAEILMLKRVLEMKCKALFILPFVSVTREKMFYLQRMFSEAGIKVDGYMGSQVPTKGFDSIDIAVCTIEKANGLVNRLMEADQLHNVGAIVVDEIHLIGDTSRGYLLELLLTKVLYMSKSTTDSSCGRNVQIIGMSATLPNLNVLATWLRADLYFTNYRPVPLTETLKVGPVIYDRSGNVLRELAQSVASGDSDHVLVLCQETVAEGNGVLVFCPTKSWCEKLAESIAKYFYTLVSAAREGRQKEEPRASSSLMFDFEALREVFEQLRSCQVGLDNVLAKTLQYGVAYHHAGLTYDERDIIEAGFRQGIIKVLVATSTLSSGVNLPARRVIIRTPMFHGKLLDGLVYKQMSGRAGRKRVDSQGESILICKTNERQKTRSLFEDDLKPVESCLVVKRSDEDEGNGIKRALLEVIASGVASTPADVQRYASCTFYVSSKSQEEGESTQTIIESTVGYLEKNEFITLRENEDVELNSNQASAESYVPTQLGQATLASTLSPDEALVVFADLRKARKCFVLENELHILYQVTPIYVQDQWPNLDWYQYLRLWERLPSHMKRVADLVGIEERFLNRAVRGRTPARSEAQQHALRVHKRFYVTLALHDLVHEVPLSTVARRYGASRGMLQSLQSSAATFTGMVTVFCRKLGWHNLEMLLSQFQNRLSFGIERELCDLVRISVLNAFRARALYSAGYHTVAAVAAASPPEVEKHLRSATPFESKKRSEGESERELRRRMRARCVWVNGGRALTEAEAAQEIVGEACGLMKEDAAKLGMTWKPGVTLPCEVRTKLGANVDNDGNAGCEISRDSKTPEKDTTSVCTTGKTHSSAQTALKSSSNLSTEGTLSTIPQVVEMNLQDSTTRAATKKEDNSNNSNANQQNNKSTSSLTTCFSNDETSTNGSHIKLQNNGRTSSEASSNIPVISKSARITMTTPKACNSEGGQFPHQTFPKQSPKGSGLRKPLFKTKNTGKEALSSKEELSVKGKCRGTPRQRGENSRTLKRKHTMSNSPKDFNGPKVTLVDHDEPLGNEEKTRGSLLNPSTPTRPKNKMSDEKNNFYNDCLDNFKVREDGTPSRRKTKGVLFQDCLPNSCKDSAGRVPPSRPSKQSTKVLSQVRSEASSEISNKTWEGKKTADNNLDIIAIESTSEEASDVLVSSNTETPTSTQTEVFDESPELIAVGESNDKTSPPSKVPFTGVEYKSAHSDVLAASPELYSEPLFLETEPHQDCDDSFEMQVDKLSESIGFENVNTSMRDLVACATENEEKVSMENDEKTTRVETLGEVNTPSKATLLDDEKPEQDLTSMSALCTPGMFDSEIHYSQVTPIAENDRPPDTSNQHSLEQTGRNAEYLLGNSEQFPLSSNEGLENKSPTNSEQSRRSSGSFSLRLSESLESASDSDLSTRTLAAAVAALEENERIENDNQDNDGSPVFQEVSNISLETMAAIEAMDDESRPNPRNGETIQSSCKVKQGEVESNWEQCVSDEPFMLDESRPNPRNGETIQSSCKVKQGELQSNWEQCVSDEPFMLDESSISSKKRFTEIKDLANPAVHKESKLHAPLRLPGCNETLEIIDVTRDRKTFEIFVERCKSSSFSFSVAVEKRQSTASTIGRKFNKQAKRSPLCEENGLVIEEENVRVVGVAVCWEKGKAYYLSLDDVDEQRSGQRRITAVSLEERLHRLRCIMGLHVAGHVKTAFGIKDQYKVLSRACGVILKGELQDPKIAAWLLNPGAKEKTFLQMVENFLPHESRLTQVGGGGGHGALALATQSSVPARERSVPARERSVPARERSVPARERSCVDAIFSRMLMQHLRPLLEADGLWYAFEKIEMPVISCLARMELNGFGFSNNECEQIKHVLRAKLDTLEQEAYRLAQRSFSLTSPEEVSRVLFLELKLPPDGNSDVSTSPGKAVRPTRGGRGRKVKYFKTSKDVLERLSTLHPLPKRILEWRRLNSALTKVVFPVQKEQVYCDPPLNMSRIFPTALTHTATGRVTFVEPNLQNVPRDFDINLPTVISDTPPTENLAGAKGKPKVGVYTPADVLDLSSPGPQFSVSLRSAFVPFPSGVLLAADYSQLELRLIAHLSGDGKLAGFLNAGGDAFRMIAAEIFHISQDHVSDEQRQRAKHVCYGIIYGIGAKALGQTLAVDENEAAAFVDAFKARFTGVRAYLQRTVSECRTLGYVTTISGRRRYLPNIRSSSAAAKSHAERQAVNTTVQGSAADLVKLAMANMDRRMCEAFTNCWRTHRQKSDGSRRAREEKLRGAKLVLQLHDELLFEVVEEDFSKVVEIVREEMEGAIKLSVKIPVNMKSGKSWGSLLPIDH